MMRHINKVSVIAFLAASIAIQAQTLTWQDIGFNEVAPGEQTHLYDSGGNDLTFDANGYVFQLVIDVNNNTDFAALVAAGESGFGWGIGAENHMWAGQTSDWQADDDVAVDTAQWIVPSPGNPPAGILEQNTIIDSQHFGSSYYFRWFNSTTVPVDPHGVEAGLIWNPIWTIPSTAESTDWLDGIVTETFLTYPPDGETDFRIVDNTGSIYVSPTGEGWQSMQMVPEPGTFALFGIGLLTVAAGRRKLRKSA